MAEFAGVWFVLNSVASFIAQTNPYQEHKTSTFWLLTRIVLYERTFATCVTSLPGFTAQVLSVSVRGLSISKLPRTAFICSGMLWMHC